MNSSRFPWLASALFLSGGLGFLGARLLSATPLILPPCLFKSLTGLPCATCGLTRCGLALSRGDWRLAFHWHPVGMLLLLALPLVMAWDLRRALRGDIFPDLPNSLAARLAVAGVFLSAWALQVARGI